MVEEQQQPTSEALVTQFIEDVWSQGDLETADEIVAEDYVEHDPALPEPIHGREAFKENVAGFREALAGLEKDIEEIIVDDDSVAVHYTFVGTHEAELWGTEPTGQRVTQDGVFFFEIDDNQITEATHLWNAYGLLQEIDAIPESPGW